MLKYLFFAIFVLLFPCVLRAEEHPIGYVKLPIAKKIDVKTKGTPYPVLVGGKVGEVWYEEQTYSREHLRFDVYAEPSESSEKLVSYEVTGAEMQLRCESGPGKFIATPDEARRYEEGKTKLFVFEKRDDWVKVQFLNQPPWSGRFSWIKLGPNLGGFVSTE